MSVFDGLHTIINNLFSVKDPNAWVQRTNASKLNIENCGGVAKKDQETNTCALCVALNKTVFKNSNKPDYYHPNCRCKNTVYDLKTVTLIFPIEKITQYLFVNPNKRAMMHSMGYTMQDAKELYGIIENAVKNHFLSADYILKTLNANGQHIEIRFNLQGKNNHSNEVFACHTGCVVWPNGKIRIATPLIQDKELIL